MTSQGRQSTRRSLPLVFTLLGAFLPSGDELGDGDSEPFHAILQ